MQFKTLLFSSLSATAALAAPAIQDRAAKDMMAAAAGQWTITSLSRTCNAALTSCSWTFGINDGTAITPCTVVVGGTPATQTNGGPATCGAYTVTSGWSGQFGEGNGFTTLAVVNNAAKLIVYPAYTDKQLTNGTVVTPDQSYTPQALP